MTSAHPWADVLRVANFALGAGSIALTAVVLYAYARAYNSWLGRRWLWMGMLPRHVVLVSLSYLTFLLMGIADSIEHLHEPVRAQTFGYFIGFALGAWSLWDLIGVEQARTIDIRKGNPTDR
jgi:hypothetical protein